MKRLISHIMRLFRKFWIVLMFAFICSPLLGLLVFSIATIISLAFFEDPKEAKDISDYFTEEELRKIENDEEIDDEEYLVILAKSQSYACPQKIDRITTWTGSEVMDDRYIFNYEIDDRFLLDETIDLNVLRQNILSRINKDDNYIRCIISTNRNLVYRYWHNKYETIDDITITREELINL